MVTLAKGKQNVSACIFDVETSCACALEPRIYNDCGNWSGPGKQNVSACIFDVETSCACALEPRIYNDCGNWSGPSTGLDPLRIKSNCSTQEEHRAP